LAAERKRHVKRRPRKGPRHEHDAEESVARRIQATMDWFKGEIEAARPRIAGPLSQIKKNPK